MRKLSIVLGVLAAGVIAVCICKLKYHGQTDADNDSRQEALIHRIEQIRTSQQSFKDNGEGLINDILAVSNRETQITMMRFLAQNVKAMPADNLDLRLRYDELDRCRQFSEQCCVGFRRIGGCVDDIWDLRFAMLTRYVNATNSCRAEWDKFVRYEKEKEERKEKKLAAAGIRRYCFSGTAIGTWPKKMAGALDYYLMWVTNRWYPEDSKSLSADERRKVKLYIEHIVGRKLVFHESTEEREQMEVK